MVAELQLFLCRCRIVRNEIRPESAVVLKDAKQRPGYSGFEMFIKRVLEPLDGFFHLHNFDGLSCCNFNWKKAAWPESPARQAHW
jgi:hypothetical protein